MNTFNTPFFSIIIPTYNRADLILNTLQTVMDQTYKNYEIIVVDNCSTDNTKEILQPYIEANKITFIQHERNFERAKSRNTGMQHAKGDFVTFLDSDDFMYVNNLLDASQYAKDNQEIKIFHNLYELVDDLGNVIYRYPTPNITNPLNLIIEGNFLSCIGVFIHRDIYKKFTFTEDKSITGSEDWDFWLRIIPYYPKVGQIEKVNSGILQHPARTVNQQDLDKIIVRKKIILDSLLKDSFYRSVYQKEKKKFISNMYIYAAVVANQYKLFSKGLNYNLKAVLSDFLVITKLRFLKSFGHSILRK